MCCSQVTQSGSVGIRVVERVEQAAAASPLRVIAAEHLEQGWAGRAAAKQVAAGWAEQAEVECHDRQLVAIMVGCSSRPISFVLVG